MKFWLYNTSNSKSKTIQTYFCIEAMKTRCFFFVLWKFWVAVHFVDEVGFKNNCCSDYIWRAGWNTHQRAYNWQKLKIFSSLNLPNRFHVATFTLGVFNTSCSRCLLRWSSELKYAAVTFLESSARTWHTHIYKSHFSIPWWTTMTHLLLLSMRKPITLQCLIITQVRFVKRRTGA